MDTVIFHFDPLTGEDIKIITSTDGETEGLRVDVKDTDGRWVSALEGVDAIAGPLIDAFLVSDGNETIGMLDEFLQVSPISVAAPFMYLPSNLHRSGPTLP